MDEFEKRQLEALRRDSEQLAHKDFADLKRKVELTMNQKNPQKQKKINRWAAVAAAVVVVALTAYFALGSIKPVPIATSPESTGSDQNKVRAEAAAQEDDYSAVYRALKKSFSNQGSYFSNQSGAANMIRMDESALSESADMSVGTSLSSKMYAYDSTDHSETNIQVEGVDEADIVKTDGTFIYTLSSGYFPDDELWQNVISVVRAEDLSLCAQLPVSGPGSNDVYVNAFELFVKDDQLMLVGSYLEPIEMTNYDTASAITEENPGAVPYDSPSALPDDNPSAAPESGESDEALEPATTDGDSYNTDYVPTYYREYTTVTIYKIGQDGSLTKERNFQQEGSYVSSRLTGDNLYLISNKSVYEGTDALAGETLSKRNIEKLIPAAGSDGEATLLPASCIAIAPNAENTFTVVSALSLTDESKTETQALLGKNSSVVYATAHSLYVAGQDYEWETEPITDGKSGTDDAVRYQERSAGTQLQKFTLGDGSVSLAAEGQVPGSVHNQFSMDESGGYLRIVTTENISIVSGSASQTESGETVSTGIERLDSTTENRLFVLDENLNQVGESQSLAPGESVQSVRFIGSMAYVVTFLQRDPLFAIDVSDPQNPQVLGQLKIPGFSSYLHPLDETTLIGIGFDADEEGFTTGLKFSLFDLSDPANPKEHSKLTISGDCSSSATYDHKAVTYRAEDGLLVIPLSSYGSYRIGNREYTGGGAADALVLTVSKTDGFTVKGFIADPKADIDENSYYYDRSIQRTAYIENLLYTISGGSVMQVALDNLKIQNQLDLFDEQATYAALQEAYGEVYGEASGEVSGEVSEEASGEVSEEASGEVSFAEETPPASPMPSAWLRAD